MRCTEPLFPASYEAVHRFDEAAMQRPRRDRIVPCAIQPRDVSVVLDVRRYKFLTAPQVRELWWPGASVQAADRRLLKLFHAGLLDRFRPICRRGSFPWTYQLGLEGHRVLQASGLVEARERFVRREVYDYGHVLHDLQLNAWVIAFRHAAGRVLLSWEGEMDVEVPQEARGRQDVLQLGNYWSVHELRDPRARLVRPDAVLEVARPDNEGHRLFFVEYDRTRRVDKNFEKFRRYDTFLCWWWRMTPLVDRGEAPYVIFVCQDPESRERFVRAADHEVTGHHWHASWAAEASHYVGRRNMLFAVEQDAHRGQLEAWRLPAFPPDHRERDPTVNRVRLAPRRARQSLSCC